MTEVVSHQIPRAEFSTRTLLIIQPIMANGIEPPISGSPGQYECIFVLNRPGAEAYFDGLDIPSFIQSGRSLLLFPHNVAKVRHTLIIDGQHYVQISSHETSKFTP